MSAAQRALEAIGRAGRPLTAYGLARALGVAPSSVGRWLSGEVEPRPTSRAKLELLEQLAHAHARYRARAERLDMASSTAAHIVGARSGVALTWRALHALTEPDGFIGRPAARAFGALLLAIEETL